MLLRELLEENFSDQASLVRRFDFMQLDNRRFIFDHVSRRLIIGGKLPRSRSLEGSHAEDWFNVTGSNKNFDRCVRGWIGVGGSFRNGVIHFAPQADVLTDGAFAVLQLFANNNADPKCKVVGSSDGNTYKLGDLPVKFPQTEKA